MQPVGPVVRHQAGTLTDDVVWHANRSDNAEILIEHDADEDIEQASIKIAEWSHPDVLPASAYPPGLYLVSQTGRRVERVITRRRPWTQTAKAAQIGTPRCGFASTPRVRVGVLG